MDRWEESLENLSLWRFLPSPIHGDLSETSIHVDHGRVCALTGFSSAHVGDPAVDIAWVFARASDEFLERFHEAYQQTRSEKDLHLLERAELLSELAVVRWLVHGLHSGDSDIVDEARAMLAELSASVGESAPKRTEEPAKTANDSSTSEEESSSQSEETSLRTSEPAPASPLATEAAQSAASSGRGEGHARPHSGPIRLSAHTSQADSEGGSGQAAEAPTEHIDMSAILPTHE